MPLDYETHQFFYLQVAVFDGVNTAVADVNITLLNVNEHAPVFQHSFYTFDVSDVKRGEELVRVQASDADRDSEVTYSFADPSMNRCVPLKRHCNS